MMVKSKLEKQLNNIMRAGYISTFKGAVYTEESLNQVKQMAKTFADTIAPDLADAIDGYIKSADINVTLAGNQTFTVAGTCGVGPVTGTAIGPLTGIIKGGIS